MDDSPSISDRGPRLLIILWPQTGVALFIVILRIVFRVRWRSFGWDDSFMILAMIFYLGWSIVLTIYATRGGGQHIWDLEARGEDNLATVQFLHFASMSFGVMSSVAGKVSISALLLNIIRHSTNVDWQKRFIWIFTIGLNVAIGTTCAILVFSQCSPPQRLWDKRVDGTCLDPHVLSRFAMFTGAFNTIADACLALLPMNIIWELGDFSSAKSTHVKLTFVFALNLLTSVFSGIKTKQLAILGDHDDLTWRYFTVAAWRTSETFLLIVCGTIPTLYPALRGMRSLVQRLKEKIFHPELAQNAATRALNPSVLTIGRVAVRRNLHREMYSVSTECLIDITTQENDEESAVIEIANHIRVSSEQR